MPRGGWVGLGTVIGALLLGGLLTVTGRVGLGGALAIAAALPIVLAAHRRPRDAALLAGVAVVGLRILLGDVTASAPAAPPTGVLDGAWTADVLTLGSTADGQQRATLLVRGATQGGPWRTYAWLPRYPAIVPTDQLTFDGTLEPVRLDGSDFAAYLTGADIVATTRISAMRLAPQRSDVFGVAEQVRSAADLALARVLPEPVAGLASGILVGRRDRVSREVTDSFTATGLSHVVAISGWNICLVAAVVGGLLSAMGLSRRSRTIAIVLALVGFTLLAGGGASVIRAALMGGVALVARETGRPGSAAAALGLAVALLLCIDPAMVEDVGFQLSVAATAGLLAWGSRLTGRMSGSDPGRARRWLAESMGVSLAAQAATLPLVLLHFGRLSLVSPLANLLVAPIVAPAMLVGAIALVAGLIVGAGAPFVVGAPFALLGWLVLGSMVAIAGVLARVPLASVELGPPIAATLALGTLLAVAAVAWRARGPATVHEVSPVARAQVPEPRRPSGPSGATPVPTTGPAVRPRPRWRRRMVAIGLVVVLIGAGGLGVLAVARPGSGRLSVTALDVGQGDAILVEGPRGSRMLLDSGPDPDRLLNVLDRHVPAWDRHIDLVILTHPHEDHVAGLATLLARYRVGAIAENGMLGAGPGDTAFRTWLGVTHVTTQRLVAGDRLSLDGIPIAVRWPIRGEVPDRSPSVGRQVNDTSIVLDLRYGERRFVLTGDIEDDVDPRILASGAFPVGGRVDVLKVAHHGSRTATSEAWLNALQPRVALVSAGIGNPYGHPAPATIARLRAHGARVLRTDLDGDSQASTDGHDLRTGTSGGRPQAAVRTAIARAVATPSGRIAAGFLCAIPIRASAIGRLNVRPLPAPHPARGWRVPPPVHPRPDQRPSNPGTSNFLAACYDRTDGARPCGRSRPVPDALAVGVTATTRRGRRRYRVLPRARSSTRGPPGRPATRGEHSLAP